jgi:hypothetical protein
MPVLANGDIQPLVERIALGELRSQGGVANMRQRHGVGRVLLRELEAPQAKRGHPLVRAAVERVELQDALQALSSPKVARPLPSNARRSNRFVAREIVR